MKDLLEFDDFQLLLTLNFLTYSIAFGSSSNIFYVYMFNANIVYDCILHSMKFNLLKWQQTL